MKTKNRFANFVDSCFSTERQHFKACFLSYQNFQDRPLMPSWASLVKTELNSTKKIDEIDGELVAKCTKRKIITVAIGKLDLILMWNRVNDSLSIPFLNFVKKELKAFDGDATQLLNALPEHLLFDGLESFAEVPDGFAINQTTAKKLNNQRRNWLGITNELSRVTFKLGARVIEYSFLGKSPSCSISRAYFSSFPCKATQVSDAWIRACLVNVDGSLDGKIDELFIAVSRAINSYLTAKRKPNCLQFTISRASDLKTNEQAIQINLFDPRLSSAIGSWFYSDSERLATELYFPISETGPDYGGKSVVKAEKGIADLVNWRRS